MKAECFPEITAKNNEIFSALHKKVKFYGKKNSLSTLGKNNSLRVCDSGYSCKNAHHSI